MRRRVRVLLMGSLVVGTVTLALPGASMASAATIAVTTTSDEFTDPGPGSGCSLREAIRAANDDTAFGGCPAGSGDDTVSVPAGLYRLTLAGASEDTTATGDLDIGSTITFRGAGAGDTVIDGNGIDRVLDILPAAPSVAISDMTIRGGVAPGTDDGGGILNNSAALRIERVAVTGNRADDGGGIDNDLSSSEEFTAVDSLLSGNTATDDSGGVDGQGITTLINVTVSGNQAGGDGGGVRQFSDTTTLINVTVMGNSAGTGGGGTGGGVYHDGGGTDVLNLKNTIVAGNTATTGPDCSSSPTSQGHNIVGTTAGCTFVPATGDRVDTDPRVGPLADNGGPTMTHALLKGSPAIDAADPAAAPPMDQRGLTRKAPDVGAYELVLCARVPVNLIGTKSTDKLRGTNGADGMLGFGGRDTLVGRGGNDGLCGGAGKDILKGGPGRDRLLGQGGKDLLVGGPGKDLCKGGPGRDRGKTCEKGRL